VESSCEYGDEPSGHLNVGKVFSNCTVSSFSRKAQVMKLINVMTDVNIIKIH
jgi:hypothetical protein